MGYEEDPNRDENGEPLMDFDDLVSDGDSAGSPVQGDFLEDDVEEWGDAGRDRSPTPVFDEDKVGKPRKRLVKKGDAGTSDKGGGGFSRSELYDDDIFNEVEEDMDGDTREFVREDEGRKRKKQGKEGVKEKKKVSKGERRFGGSSSNSGGKGASGSRAGGESRKDGFSGGKFSGREDGEVKEMWDTIAGGDSEDDQEGPRTLDDDNFIDDTGVEPAEGYGSDGPRSPGDAPQAEEGEEYDEVKELFKMGKKRKKSEKSPAEMALLVERVMAELEIVAEEDADLNRNGKPAINKLKKLPLLTEVLSKKQLQQEFIDHGVLTLLKNWLEPLPDGSLPNINIRAAILQILANFPIDLEQYDRREQLKKSGLGKVIMFLSKSDEETTSNRKLAKELVDKWSRPIFNKSTRFEDMRNIEDDRTFRRPTPRRPVSKAGGESRDGNFDFDNPRDRLAGQSPSRLHASRPEATSMDFVVRPQSKIDPEEIRARAKQAVHDQRRMKMNKKLQQLKAPKKKQLQATRLSVEGRGMLKYL